MRPIRNHRGPLLRTRRVAAPAVAFGGITAHPVARSMSLGCGRGELTCSWPSAVLVTRGGRTSRHPIVDVTRLIQLALLACLALFACGLATRAANKERRSS